MPTRGGGQRLYQGEGPGPLGPMLATGLYCTSYFKNNEAKANRNSLNFSFLIMIKHYNISNW